MVRLIALVFARLKSAMQGSGTMRFCAPSVDVLIYRVRNVRIGDGVMSSTYIFESHLEDFLAQACVLLRHHGEEEAASVIVNSKPHLRYAASYDNFNGGCTGHSLTLKVPFDLYIPIESRAREVADRIRTQINEVALGDVDDESLDSVVIGIDIPTEVDWRSKSGLLKTGSVLPVTEDASARIWKSDCSLRVLISHKDEDKQAAKIISEALYLLGVSAFVAHENIINATIWPVELTNALKSMDACVPLLTKSFHQSYWTDQEVGWAYGRGVPVIPLNLGEKPYGFMSSIQAKQTSTHQSAREVFNALKLHPRWSDALIHAVARCPNFDTANNFIWDTLDQVKTLEPQQVQSLVAAANTNEQIYRSYAFVGPRQDGKPFIECLKKLTSDRYRYIDHHWTLLSEENELDDELPF